LRDLCLLRVEAESVATMIFRRAGAWFSRGREFFAARGVHAGAEEEFPDELCFRPA
jgi:hypothetical protein